MFRAILQAFPEGPAVVLQGAPASYERGTSAMAAASKRARVSLCSQYPNPSSNPSTPTPAGALNAGGSVEGATGWNPGASAADYIDCNRAPKEDNRPVSFRGPGWDRLSP